MSEHPYELLASELETASCGYVADVRHMKALYREAAAALRAMMLREQTARQWMQHKGACGDFSPGCSCGLDDFLSDAAAEPSKGKADE